ncbi:MAG: hypothetical protein ACRD2F_06805 [Terriglobales bacterium]
MDLLPYLRPRILVPAILALALAALLAGCQEYYIPPPPPAVTVSPSAGELGFGPVTVQLASLSSTGTITPGTQQFKAAAYYVSSQAVTWSLVDPVTGANLPGGKEPNGSTPYGTINSSGLYTAPTLPPAADTFVVEATAVQSPSTHGQSSLELITPSPVLTSVTVATSGSNPASVPAMVQGNSYTLTLQGQFFYSNSTASISSGTAGAVSPPSGAKAPYTSLTVPVTVNAAGLTQVGITSPNSTAANPVQLVVEPDSTAASSALAVLIEPVGTDSKGNPVLGNKIYVPRTTADAVAVVNGDTGLQLTSGGAPLDIAMPSGFGPTAAAADPQTGTVAVISATVDNLVVVNAANDTVVNTFAVPVSGTASFSDGVSCGICGVVVDATRNEAILDTAAGYLTVNLSTGAASSVIAAPAAENFAYNPATQDIYAPYFTASGSGLDLIDLATDSVTPYALPGNAGFSLGTELTAAALDRTTLLAWVPDAATGEYTAINFNNATSASGNVTAPAAQFSITSGCGGGWRAAQLAPSGHFGWFGNSGGCLAVGTVPSGATAGAPSAPTALHWAQLGAVPDGVDWTNALGPQSETVFIGLDGTFYGLALRGDGHYLARVGLAAMQAAPAPASPVDSAQVDASSAITYIPLN